MKKCTLFVVLFLVFAANIFAQSNDVAPRTSTSNIPEGKIIAQLDLPPGALLRNYNIDSLTPPNVGGYGVVWTGSNYIVSMFNANLFYRFNADWSLRDQFAVTGGTGTGRDMVFAKGLLWYVNVTGSIFGVDTGTKAVVKTITTSLVQIRGIGWDPVRNAFLCGTNSFYGPVVAVDTNGATIAGATFAPGVTYGIGYDANPAGPYIVISRDLNPSSLTQTMISRYNATTFAKVDSFTVTVPLTVAPTTGLSSGGSEVYTNLIPGKRTFVGIVQGTPDRVIIVDLGDLPAPPVGGNTLVIMNDSTTPTAQRTADRDTLRKYVNMLVGNVTYMTKNTTTVFPSLSGYSTIILQETAFDAVAVRSLVAGQRQALKDWLASGTAGAKKSLIMIGGDMGYAYDQTGQTQLDTVFSRSYGGFQYVSDNAAATAPFANVGQFPGSIFDVMSTTPPGGSYWPDGCRPISGGTTWETYQGRTALDSAAGIFKSGTGWNVITTFQDPRYYTGTGGGAGDMGFKRVLKNMCAWVRTNGGLITSTTPISTVVADRYSLSQNYPNPFNPSTKINFAIPTNGFVSLKVYDIAGKEVMTLVNKNMTVGSYAVDFNGSLLSSGVYFYRLESANFVETKKMMLVK